MGRPVTAGEVERKWAYAAESVSAVLFRPRANRWTCDRGRDLTHLSRATGAT